MKALVGIAVAASIASLTDAYAQSYPNKPITLIVPFAAGGPSDTLARILADRMRVSLGQPIIIETIPGAGGSLGTGRAVRAVADGYSLAIGNWSTHVANGASYSLKYDPLADFSPIALLSNEPLLLLGKKSLPARDLKQLIAWLKANPDKASSGTSGYGGASHVAGLLFEKATGTRFNLISYRGAGPAIRDLVAEHVDLMFGGPSISLEHLRNGGITAFAVAAPTRSELYPHIPTSDEAGLPGFHISVWHGLWAPKGTPQEVIAKLNSAVQEALADPAVRLRYTELALELPRSDQRTPHALADLQKAEIEKWWPIIKAANLKSE